MGFLQRIFRPSMTHKSSAETIYAALMRQSRQPEFFGSERFPDTYDGRVDILTMHIAVFMDAVRTAEAREGINTGRNNEGSLSQAVFDVMVRDFDTALREEGYTDTGVKKRIKPIVGFFYKRLKTLTESLGDPAALLATVQDGALKEESPKFAQSVTTYLQSFQKELANKSFDDLANHRFSFPKI